MVKIVTDSAADFEVAELEKMNVTCLPMSVYFGDKHYLENVSITKEEFFEMLETNPNFPKTSQPAPALFEDLFTEAEKNNDEIVYIPMSAALSGDYATAIGVRNQFEYEHIYILESRMCTGGQRLLVEYAVKLRDKGLSGREILDALEKIKYKAVIYTAMDTLEYLHKNGRLSNMAYYVATLGKIKPIMHVSDDGKAEIVSKHIGLKKAIEYIVERLDYEKPNKDFPFYVMYTKEKDNAYKLREKLIEKGIEIPEENIIPVGAVVGAHIGPYACAVAYIKE